MSHHNDIRSGNPIVCAMCICGLHVQERRNVLHSSPISCGSSKIPLGACFNNPLLNACKHEFTERKIIGCYFHLKQFLFRKFKKLLLPAPDIYLVLKLIEIPTLVPKEEINDAINFINLKLGEKAARFSSFWSYFTKNGSKAMILSYGI
ncbi:hypothetical protein HZS_2016 [Henneguya salminicola]|nr:hypothetical protein HZS_2016 [Henneguya salminicola]